MEWIAVGVGCLAIGVCLGLSGYGGFLVPPLLVWALGQPPREAIAHALLASLLPALLGALLYRRQHGVDPRLVLLLCAGALPGVLLGNALSQAAPAWVLQALIGAAVLAAGVALIRFGRRRAPNDDGALTHSEMSTPTAAHPKGRAGATGEDVVAPESAPARTRTSATSTSLAAGALSGSAGVLVGVGGPLVTTPVLVAGGYALAPAVGAGLANNAVVAGVGALSFLPHVSLDFAALAVVAATQLLGVGLGVRWRQLVPAAAMTGAVAVLAVLTGTAFLVGALT